MHVQIRETCVIFFTGNSSSSIEDEEVESASVDYSDFNFNKSKQCEYNIQVHIVDMLFYTKFLRAMF